MKLLGNWSDPQIEDEGDATVLYQMLGSLCFYVVLTTYGYNHLEIYNCTATEQYEGKGVSLRNPYFVVLLSFKTLFLYKFFHF